MAIHLLSDKDPAGHNKILHWRSFQLDSVADVADLPTDVGYDSEAFYWDNGTICLYTFDGTSWIQRI